MAPKLPTSLASILVASTLALGNAGCVKKMILNSTIASTRIGAGAADTIGDYDLARAAASAGVMQFEGMHRLAPDNEDALFLLMKGWAGYGYAFASDDYEAAVLAEDDTAAAYHQKRAKLAFDRSVAYGLELMGKEGEGFKEASDKDADTIKAWLDKHFDEKEDAEVLFWTGSAWLARVNLLKDQREYVAKLFVGVAMLERSRQLDPEYMQWGATSTLGAYHARSPMAELDEAKKLLDLALEKTQHKSLGVQLNYSRYACAKADQTLYEKMLNEVVNAEDPDPNLRLQNTVAKRRAQRALTKQAMEDCGFRGPATTPAAPAKP
ncbi:MAG: hypothetical protein NVS3B10_07980 [Polyangiales bacterium]